MRASAFASLTRSLGSFSSLVFSFFSGTGFSCPGSGSGFGTSTILTGGFGSGSRLAALKEEPSRIGISGTRTVVAQAATLSVIATVIPSLRCMLICLLPCWG
jgi:hypothetical protein